MRYSTCTQPLKPRVDARPPRVSNGCACDRTSTDAPGASHRLRGPHALLSHRIGAAGATFAATYRGGAQGRHRLGLASYGRCDVGPIHGGAVSTSRDVPRCGLQSAANPATAHGVLADARTEWRWRWRRHATGGAAFTLTSQWARSSERAACRACGRLSAVTGSAVSASGIAAGRRAACIWCCVAGGAA